MDSRLFEEALLGHGNWNATFWFVGVEGGMASDDHARETTARHNAWLAVGGQELVDLIPFQLALAEELRAFDEKAANRTERYGRGRLQPTWGPLMTILTFLVPECACEDRARYQCEKLGTSNGDTLLLEARAGASKNQRKKGAYSEDIRMQRIRNQLEKSSGRLVVFYGNVSQGLCFDFWPELIWHMPEPSLDLQVARFGHNTFALIKHPVFFARPGEKRHEYFARVGLALLNGISPGSNEPK